MLLSLSGFLFEDEYSSQSIGFAEFCAIARSVGYQGVELRRTQVGPDTPRHSRRELLRMVRNRDLSVTCLTARGLPAGGRERDEFFLRYLELCRDMECGLLKIGGDTVWLRRAAGKAEEYGVTLASNNHVGGPLETVEGTRRHLESIAHPNFGLLYDSLHLYLAGEDYLDCIPEFVGKTRNILVHSLRPAEPDEKAASEIKSRRWVPALPDEECIQNWKAIFKALKELGYDGLVTVIESGWPHQKREQVALRCANIIRRLWKEAERES